MSTAPVRAGSSPGYASGDERDENRAASPSRPARPSRAATAGLLQNLVHAGAARSNPMRRAAFQQPAAGSSLPPLIADHAADKTAAEQAQRLAGRGNIATDFDAAREIGNLRASIPRHELLAALVDRHLNGKINEQTYLLYANRLKADVGLDAPIGPWLAAREAIDRGATADEAIAANDLRDPEDIAGIRAHAEHVAARGSARAPAPAFRAAREAMATGATLEQAAAAHNVTHAEDLADLRSLAPERGYQRGAAGGSSRHKRSIRERFMSRMRRR